MLQLALRAPRARPTACPRATARRRWGIEIGLCTYARASKFYLRTNPIVAAGFSPKPAFTIYAGVGPGGAILSPSASNVDAGPAEEELAVTGAALLGLRFTGAAFPIVLEARADAVSDRGASAMLTFSLLIAD